MNPDSIPGEMTNKVTSSSSIFGGIQKERCPLGTVPIRRTTKEDLVNAKKIIKKTKLISLNNTYPNAPTTNQASNILYLHFFWSTHLYCFSN